MLNTCKTTDIPPNPNKNAQSIILTEMAFTEIEAIILTPLVSSIIPLISPDENSGLIFIALKIGLINLHSKSKIPLLFIIDRITLKSTTKPPISTTVLVAFVILVPKIFPKLPILFEEDVEYLILCFNLTVGTGLAPLGITFPKSKNYSNSNTG